MAGIQGSLPTKGQIYFYYGRDPGFTPYWRSNLFLKQQKVVNESEGTHVIRQSRICSFLMKNQHESFNQKNLPIGNNGSLMNCQKKALAENIDKCSYSLCLEICP